MGYRRVFLFGAARRPLGVGWKGTGRGPGLPGGAGGQAHDLDARRGGLQLQSAIGAGNLRAYVQGTGRRGPCGTFKLIGISCVLHWRAEPGILSWRSMAVRICLSF